MWGRDHPSGEGPEGIAGDRPSGLSPAILWLRLGWELLAGVVNGVVTREDQLGDGDKGVALLD